MASYPRMFYPESMDYLQNLGMTLPSTLPPTGIPLDPSPRQVIGHPGMDLLNYLDAHIEKKIHPGRDLHYEWYNPSRVSGRQEERLYADPLEDRAWQMAEIDPPGGKLGKLLKAMPGRDVVAKQGTVLPWMFEGLTPPPEVTGTGPRGSVLTADIYDSLAGRARGYWSGRGIDITKQTPENQGHLSEMIAQEVEAAHRAKFWATKPGDTYMQVDDGLVITAMNRDWHELLTDPQAEQMFKLSLAIGSGGQRTWPGYNIALDAYEHFRKYGRFPADPIYMQYGTHFVSREGAGRLKAIPGGRQIAEDIVSRGVGAGEQLHNQNKAFARINYLLDDMGSDELYKFLNTKFTARELKYGGMDVQGYKMDEEIYGSGIFGPKIGNEYFPNLMGDPNQVTMDRWFMNSYARLTGDITNSGVVEKPIPANLREFLRGTIGQSQEKLRRRGISLDKNMIQAVWWGLERDMALKYGADIGDTTDYAEAAMRKALEEGRWSYAKNWTAERWTKEFGPLAHKRLFDVSQAGFGESGKRDFLVRQTVGQVRRNVGQGSQGGHASPFRRAGDRASRKHGIGQFKNVEAQPMRLDIKSRNHLNSVDLSTSDLLEITDPRKAQVFHSRISGAKKANKFGSSVHVYDPEEYAGMRLFMIDDGSAGFALKGDDLVSAFAFPKGKGGTGKDRKQSVISMLLHGIAMGGRRADSFDTILPRRYAHVGMRPVARTPWNDELAKKYMPDWDKKLYKDFNNGEPDVIYYAYDPKYHGPYRKGEGKLVATEEEALEIQQRAVEKFNPEKRPQSPEMDVLQQARQQPTSAAGVREEVGEYGTGQMELPLRWKPQYGDIPAAGELGQYTDETLHAVGTKRLVDVDKAFDAGAVKTRDLPPGHEMRHAVFFRTREEAERFARQQGDNVEFISGETTSLIRSRR